MKLAEALIQRSDIQKNIAQLRERLVLNAKVQEGDSPAENPEALMDALASQTAAFIELVRRINRTNAAPLADGIRIADLLTERDALTTQAKILREFLKEAAARTDRYSAQEIAILSTVNVAEKQKAVDLLAKHIRELDTRIQGLNWTTDLL